MTEISARSLRYSTQKSSSSSSSSWPWFYFSFCFFLTSSWFYLFWFQLCFWLVPHSILLHKLCVYVLSDSYVNWFHTYLSDRYSAVTILGAFSLLFAVSSGVPQGSVLGPFLFNIFADDICNVIKYSRYLLFAYDIKIFRAVNSADDCTFLQTDMEHIQAWCARNCMKLNISRTRVITFSRKTKGLYYVYKIQDSSITCTDTIKDLGVQIDSNCISMHT